jgi:hypothetical protein
MNVKLSMNVCSIHSNGGLPARSAAFCSPDGLTNDINIESSRGDYMSEYIRELRSLVGTRPLILVGAVVIIINLTNGCEGVK